MKRKITLLVLILLLVLAFSGCSAGTANGAFKVTTLQVDRGTTIHFNQIPPLSRTIVNSNAVQKLFDAAMALPKMPTRVVSCPLDNGLVYHLRFQRNGLLIQQMEMYDTGCPYILVSKNDVRSLTDSFISLSAQTLGITPSQMRMATI